MRDFIVRFTHAPWVQEAHLKALEMEKEAGGKIPYSSFLPEDITKWRESHYSYVLGRVSEGKIFCAGPTADYSWGVFIYTADSLEEAERLYTEDPFFKGGIFADDYEIKEMHHLVTVEGVIRSDHSN